MRCWTSSAAITAVAIPRTSAWFTTEFEGCESGRRTGRLGRDLIHRDARSNVGTIRLSRLGTGQKDRSAAGMVTRPVAIGAPFVMGQAAEDHHVILDRCEGLQDVW